VSRIIRLNFRATFSLTEIESSSPAIPDVRVSASMSQLKVDFPTFADRRPQMPAITSSGCVREICRHPSPLRRQQQVLDHTQEMAKNNVQVISC
jgi:hypothetical protein